MEERIYLLIFSRILKMLPQHKTECPNVTQRGKIWSKPWAFTIPAPSLPQPGSGRGTGHHHSSSSSRLVAFCQRAFPASSKEKHLFLDSDKVDPSSCHRHTGPLGTGCVSSVVFEPAACINADESILTHPSMQVGQLMEMDAVSCTDKAHKMTLARPS